MFKKIIFILFLTLTISLNCSAKNKKNSFILSFGLFFPGSTLEKITNNRTGQSFSLYLENSTIFKNFPLMFIISYNHWEKGRTSFSNWNQSEIKNFEIGIEYIEYLVNKRIFMTFGLKASRWRIDRNRNFYASTTKVYPNVIVGYITKNNWVISATGIGYMHVTKDIRLHYTGISIGKRF